MSLSQQSEEIRESLLAFIILNFLVERADIDPNKSLVDEGIIDSFGLIEIFAYLQKRHGITIDGHDMKRDNFGSVTRIVEFVQQKILQ